MVGAERARLPERVFRQEYGGEFLEGSGAVFRYVRECATGEFGWPVRGLSYYGGLDLARVQDFTVLAILDEHRRVAYVDRFHRLDWSMQIARLTPTTEEYGCSVFVDSTGAGEPIYESLLLAGVSAQPYPFTQASKAALINNLAMMLERRQLQLPRPEDWPEGIDELEAFEYSVTDQGTVRTGAPYGCHDDCVVALALAAWHFKPSACGVGFG